LYTERQIDEKESGEKGGIYTLLFSTFKVNKNWKLVLFSLLSLTRGERGTLLMYDAILLGK
jgi:hypothetical protein